ncbi:response regulator containing a CheY-like receiver domain and an HTH DNA-binding domain [Xenococcus sp. PCC 7305]|uniref:response regulator n=1 Tax=Xenococcus sp. PCC 7305 TaxID=102125 RepID=UPI0002AC0D96|nr:response regulator transcription factor [Xenococcus sp. PCC 7305]ELS01425.1 response regulator containing a CheY-like receiver domain and an HTH DNA-binding domain [Xenococcus sp. PCC 7305]
MIRILIVDDQNFTREAVKSILEQESDFEIIGQAENGVKALAKIDEMRPDVAVIDLEMPEMNGFVLTQKINQQFSQTKVVILSSCEDHDSINAAVKAGAKGYLLKSTSGSELTDTIRYVQRGYFQLGPGLFEKLLSGFIQDNSDTTKNLFQLENKAQDNFARLEQEIKSKNEQTRNEMFLELNKQIKHLKNEFRQGLGTFQYQVTNQMRQGLESLSDRINHKTVDTNNLEEKIQAWDFERQQQINNMLTGTKKTVSSLEKQVTILRYCLIFLAMSFFVEKLAVFVF